MFIPPLVHETSSSGPKRPRVTPTSDADTFTAPPTQATGATRLEQLVKEKKLLESKLKEKEGQLSKLKLVKLYRRKVSSPDLTPCWVFQVRLPIVE